LNDKTLIEFEVLVFSCGRFIAGTIQGRHFQKEAAFREAMNTYFEERRKLRELYEHFGFYDLIELAGLGGG